MKIVKAIHLSFPANTSSCQVAVHVPFKAKFVTFKDIGYVAQSQIAKVVIIKSDIVGMQPVGMTNQDNTFPSSNQDVAIEYQVPTQLSGTYNFYLLDCAGNALNSTGNTDTCCIIAEFYDENSLRHQFQDTVRRFEDSGSFPQP